MFAQFDLSLILMLLAIGLACGFLAGLLGIGGGMILVPCLLFVLGRQGVSGDAAVKIAIATAMATILFTSLSSIRAHQRRGAIRWDIVRGVVPGIFAGGLLAGAGAFTFLKGQAVAAFFVVFVGYSAWRMYRGASRQTATRASVHGPAGLAAVGTGIGFLSGMVGAGGAFLSVPYMTRCSVPIHQAVATSAAIGFPIAVANVLGYAISGWSLPPVVPGGWGYFHLPALLLIVACSVWTAPLGARAAHGLDVATLRKVFALILAVLATYTFFKSGLAG